LPAAKADLLRRLGRQSEARSEYQRALDLAPSETERRYLGKRLAEADPGATAEFIPNESATATQHERGQE